MKLGDIATIVKDTFIPSEDSTEAYVGLEHIEPHSLRVAQNGIASDAISQKLRFYKEDILFGKLRPYFRKVAFTRFDGVCSTDFWVIRAKDGFDQKFLFYVLASQEFVDFVNQASEGTRMPRAKWTYAENYEIPEFSIEEQKAIAKILSAFDDKIELNRRMNATLEAMARALFKAWFVDFEPVHANRENRPSTSASPEIAKIFPSDFENGFPSGWKLVKLLEVSERITKGTTPKKFIETGINFVKAESLSADRGFVFDKFAAIDDDTNDSLQRSKLREDDVLFSIAGTIGRIARVIPEILPANTNQALAIIRVNQQLIHPLFVELLLSRPEVQHSLTGKTVHAVQANLSLTVLGETEFVLPPTELMLNAFPKIVALDAKLKGNNRESEVLTRIRDGVLPRLISGTLRPNHP